MAQEDAKAKLSAAIRALEQGDFNSVPDHNAALFQDQARFMQREISTSCVHPNCFLIQ
jgi:hypothetical protein